MLTGHRFLEKWLLRAAFDTPEAPQPRGIAKLYGFQKQGLKFLLDCEASPAGGGILADQQGVGKTVMCAALVVARRRPARDCTPAARLSAKCKSPQPCGANRECPGNSSCQTRRPEHGQETLYCGGIGRPSDVRVIADGSLLVTDETNSLVYRVTYEGVAPPPPSGDAAEEEEEAGLGAVVLVVVLLGVAALLHKSGACGMCKKSINERILDPSDSEFVAGKSFEAGHDFTSPPQPS